MDPDQQVSPNVALSCSASRILRSNYHIIAQAPKDLVLRKPTANWQSIFQTLPMKEKVLLELQRAWICILAHYCTARLCDDPIVGLIRLANIIKEILGRQESGFWRHAGPARMIIRFSCMHLFMPLQLEDIMLPKAERRSVVAELCGRMKKDPYYFQGLSAVAEGRERARVFNFNGKQYVVKCTSLEQHPLTGKWFDVDPKAHGLSIQSYLELFRMHEQLRNEGELNPQHYSLVPIRIAGGLMARQRFFKHTSNAYFIVTEMVPKLELPSGHPSKPALSAALEEYASHFALLSRKLDGHMERLNRKRPTPLPYPQIGDQWCSGFDADGKGIIRETPDSA